MGSHTIVSRSILICDQISLKIYVSGLNFNFSLNSREVFREVFREVCLRGLPKIELDKSSENSTWKDSLSLKMCISKTFIWLQNREKLQK